MGVGYVGYHLMTAFSKHYEVIAFDVNPKRVAAVAAQLPDGSDVYVTCDPSSLGSATHFLIAVPTPLIPGTTETDTSIIRSAFDTICANVRPGATVIIESSVAVGTTRSLFSNMVKTHHIYAGMSPEVCRSLFRPCNPY
jgi:UDP-N-acetyl-D-mannosaminuronate dehydrogenase